MRQVNSLKVEVTLSLLSCSWDKITPEMWHSYQHEREEQGRVEQNGLGRKVDKAEDVGVNGMVDEAVPEAMS